ncbi:hypothetical protein Dred_0928 [Desulforamulus reducens MI-1]|uniref:PrgI family protein n=1 Tax=Desulforamulus reducens (strain ATCC BAA-1160 / DSM 100696 / MI-1) TaxID=349161 RepID=A4J311_DESRM|nr:hypothetical protein Dred_0928 [Desulforamulus reducens MI-1]
MREFRVPFSTREETPFIFGLTIREMAWIGSGFLVGLVFSFITFMIIGAKLQNIILSLPTIIPFTFLGLFLAKKRIIKGDYIETIDRYWFKKAKYKMRAHKYVNYRKII